MNLTNESSIDELKELFSACNDEVSSHILWVDRHGEVHLTSVPDHLTPAGWTAEQKENIQFRFETLQPGYGYVGPEAAQDETWMTKLYTSLIRLWEAGATGYRDHG